METRKSSPSGDPFRVDLRDFDPEVARLTDLEQERQDRKIILIASESIASRAVREAMDSPFANLYAEGLPSTRMSRLESDRLDDIERHLAYFRRYGDRRYYKGCEYANFVEALAQRRAAELFATDSIPDAPARVSADDIFVNVQPLSGAAANNAVYNAFTSPGDTIMGMSLVAGGHLTHGSPVNRSGKQYRVVSYTVDPTTGRLDYDAIRSLAREARPKIVIAGYSAYPWHIDWKAFRSICDEVGAFLLADIAHPAGLVAGRLFPSPIGVADVTMCTTHKTLCGPRGAILMTTCPRKAKMIDMGVFPGEQGGPHLHTMAAKAVAFRIAATEEFRELQRGIAGNAKRLAAALADRGLGLAYGGTETHLLLVDLKSVAGEGEPYPDGEVVSRILDLSGITCNKNTIAGDASALRPSAIRLGTTWITQRGFGAAEVDRLAELIHRVISAIRPFQIQGGRTKLGRARIDDRVIERTREDVEALLRSLDGDFEEPIDRYSYAVESAPPPANPLAGIHAAAGASLHGEGVGVPEDYGSPREEADSAANACALVDRFDRAAVSVIGERAATFLQGAGTSDLLGMEPGAGRRTLFLDRDGVVRFDATVVRLENSGSRERYLLLPEEGDTDPLVRWLRSLSDGYALLEEDDLPAKIEGPVAVEDTRVRLDASRRLTRLGLVGPSASSVLEACSGGGKPPSPGCCVEMRVGGTATLVHRHPDGDGSGVRYSLLVPLSAAADLWSAILEAGGPGGLRPAGAGAWKAASPEEAARPGTPGREALRNRPGLVETSKPFFLGQAKVRIASDGKPEYRWEPPDLPLRRTPLYELHLERTKKSLMIPFAGWEMPVWYTKVSDEHRAVRETAGLFDVSHMGVIGVRGERAARFLDLVATNFVPRLVDGRSQYSYVLDPHGRVLDDIIIYRLGPGDFQVVVNAANAEKVLAWFRAVHSREYRIDPDAPEREIDARVEIRDLRDPASGGDRRIDLALQGPASTSILRKAASGPGGAEAVEGLVPFSHCSVDLGGVPVLVSRTGYTGETFGYELFVHPDRAADLWRLLLGEGAEFGIRPTGLAARDSTRTEAGFPLYGHELAGPLEVDPSEAGYGAFVKFHKPFFVGREALRTKPDAGRMRILRFRTGKTRRFDLGDPVLDLRKRPIGKVTSCTLAGDSLVGLAHVEVAAIPPDGGEILLSWERRKDESVRAEVLPRFPQRVAATGPLDPPAPQSS
jgi:glycine cleavage system T protein